MTKPKPADELLPLVTVMVRGVVYPSVAAVSKKFGVKRNSVYAALSRGLQDRLGLKPGSPNSGANNGRAIATVLAGVSFATLREVDALLGMKPGYTSNRINRGKRGLVEDKVTAALMAKTAKAERKALQEHDKRMSRGVRNKDWET